MTLTGHHVAGTPQTIEHRQAELESVHAEQFGRPEVRQPAPASNGRGVVDESLDEVLRLASAARNGNKFAALWRGSIDGYPSASDADMALVNHLAFWLGPNRERIDEAFRALALFRSKWEREDYRERTINKAIKGRSDFFDWDRGELGGQREPRTAMEGTARAPLGPVVTRMVLGMHGRATTQASNPLSTRQPRKTAGEPGYHWEPISSAQFAFADYRPEWLCVGALVAMQPCIIGAPQKTLKTSVAVDLAISLASGTSWLGRWPCPSPRRVAMLSGESGPWAIQSTAQRVCQARGVALESLGDRLLWMFRLPQLAIPDHLDAIRDGIERDGVEVIIIDPLYLSLLAGSDSVRAENLYEIGPLLLAIAQLCLNAGATPILLHHCTKPSARKLEPLDLADLAFSGVGEFCRQWILLSRREAYEHKSGQHARWLVAGGSVGHGGCWALDVNEGCLDEDFGGRIWEVSVSTAGDARQSKSANRQEAKKQDREIEESADAEQAIHALNVRDPENLGCTFTQLRDSSGLTHRRFGRAITRLVAAGRVTETPGTYTAGQGAKKVARIIRRRQEEPGLC